MYDHSPHTAVGSPILCTRIKYKTRIKLEQTTRNLPQQLDTLVIAVGASDEGDKPVKEVLRFLFPG